LAILRLLSFVELILGNSIDIKLALHTVDLDENPFDSTIHRAVKSQLFGLDGIARHLHTPAISSEIRVQIHEY
jgi:hypothetical protein